MEDRKLAILIVVPSLRRAGAETQCIDLANGLADMGHSIHLAIYESDKAQLPRVANNVSLHCLKRASKFDFGYIFSLARIIDKYSIDVVHGVMQFASVVSWIAARISSSRPAIIAAIHTTINVGRKEELIDRFVFAPFLKRMSSIVFVCHSQKDYWLAKYPRLASKSVVIYNGVNTQQFCSSTVTPGRGDYRLDLGIPPESVVFSCVAGFREEKGHDLLVRAFASVPDNAALLLAGDGPTKARIQKQVDDLGIQGRIRFLGNLEDVRPLIAASDATVLASTAVETFSIAMLESLALSVPVIAPKIGGLEEAIHHGKTGILFAIGDEAGLANAMQTFVDSPQLARKMGMNGRTLVANRFTLEKMLSDSLDVLIAAADTR